MTENLYHCIDCTYSCKYRKEIHEHCATNKDPNNYANNHGWVSTEPRKIARDGTWLVGNIGFDSGSVILGDPCYVKHDEALFCEGQKIQDEKGNEVTLENKWSDFCAKISSNGHLPYISNGMFFTGSFGGDVEAPITVEIKNGQVAWAKINFGGRESRLRKIEYDYEIADIEESRKKRRLVTKEFIQ